MLHCLVSVLWQFYHLPAFAEGLLQAELVGDTELNQRHYP